MTHRHCAAGAAAESGTMDKPSTLMRSETRKSSAFQVGIRVCAICASLLKTWCPSSTSVESSSEEDDDSTVSSIACMSLVLNNKTCSL